MAITFPPRVHAAFNHILLKYTNHNGRADVMIFTISPDNKIIRCPLSRELIGSEAEMDISGPVKTFLSNFPPSVATGGDTKDPRLSVQYEVIYDLSGRRESFIALNAVTQNNEPLDISTGVMTKFKTVKVYDGFPRDISVLKNDGVYRMDIIDYSVLADVNLADSLGNLIFDSLGNEIMLKNPPPIVIEAAACIPESPMYIRWINTVAGVDYWMFKNSQEHKLDLKSNVIFSSYDHTPNPVPIRASMTTESSIKAGTGELSYDEYMILRDIPFSPSIELYNPKLNKWIPLTMDKSNSKMLTSDYLHTLEFTFNLPQHKTQTIW